MLRDVQWIMIYVKDLQKAINFYEDILQTEVVWQFGNYAGLKNKIVLHNIQNKNLQYAIFFNVDNVKTVCRTLKDLGVTIITEPFIIHQGHAAIVEDSEGNKLYISDNILEQN